ncbi:hypothetical protein [Halalkalibacter krulwichiae]|uniref:Uncharacterized protein n=1 Tax=Halalkalibacter krulwichiae TaxID=199441 RepID=A0A1X9M889_9BACI|nr:hypothetical protein [Halalkalibacter krulwichiae]ARK29626.1 hypothetical protein BkAM31D_06985 [Halalkalibacter krulwichiae]
MKIDLTTIYDQMPDFRSHEEAQSWFKSLFSDRFVLKDSDVIEGEKVYYYHLIKDYDAYQEYIENLSSSTEEITTVEPFKSYSTVEISEHGGISFSI